MAADLGYTFSDDARVALREYLSRRIKQPGSQTPAVYATPWSGPGSDTHADCSVMTAPPTCRR
ncbi:hypothetical protein I552_2905 [Mycobacterium xenopi 3993]|nr:hypothetical protein I552_2905 [Mycobacterium xenopi 3993]